MRSPPSSHALTIIAAAVCSVLVPLSAFAQVAAGKLATAPADAVATCERAARQSLTTNGAPPAEVKFVGSPSVQAGLSNDSQTVLHGAGSWRGAGGVRRFDYICNVDLRRPEALGLVLRDTTPAAAEPKAARGAIEPDLRHLSPAACESSAAAALKKRWPGVSEITFESGTRSLSQESPSKAELHGQGRALPAPGSPFIHFGFDCEIDPRDGRVLNTRVSG